MVNDRYIPNFVLSSPLRGISKFPLNIINEYIIKGAKIADIGSGPGYYSIRLAAKHPESTIYAIDPNKKAIDFLNEAITKKGIKNIITLCEPGNKIASIESGTIDFVLSHLMICCMTDHEGAMKEVIRILKPSGFAFISVNKSSSQNDMRSVTRDEWEEMKKKYGFIKEGQTFISRWFIMKKD
ncbi:class I SAM-dependent methyltransferase [Caldiplasma sukawensis]